jgi:hypothetical protein
VVHGPDVRAVRVADEGAVVARAMGPLAGKVGRLLALVVLLCALDRRYPALAPLHPDLVFRLQLEGRLIEASDPDLVSVPPESVPVVSRSRDPHRGQKPRPS